jgi:hypothetical protein
MNSVRIGSTLVLITGAMSLGAGVAATSVNAAENLTGCLGKVTATVQTNGTWHNTASHISEQGTTCGAAKGVARAYAHHACGGCKPVHSASGYTYKVQFSKDGKSVLHATKGSAVVDFVFESSRA